MSPVVNRSTMQPDLDPDAMTILLDFGPFSRSHNARKSAA